MAKTKTYLCWTENNAWEGETWNFYIPVPGNEKALESLRKKLGDLGECGGFELQANPVTEKEVDRLVKHDNDHTDYLNAHNKLKGFWT